MLFDAVAWTERRKVDIIIGIDPLTGASSVVLGRHQARSMSHDEPLVSPCTTATKLSGENPWHVPSADDCVRGIKRHISHLKHCRRRWGSDNTTASFWRQFNGYTEWAHLDITGVNVRHSAPATSGTISQGFGVGLLTMYLTNLAKILLYNWESYATTIKRH